MYPLRPSSWPVAFKLSLAFLAAALLPMGLTAAYNLQQSLASVRRTAYVNLELFAGTSAARLDQLVTDTHHAVTQIAHEAEVVELLSHQAVPAFASVQRTLENVVGSNPDVASVFLLDKAGACVASTNAENLGKDYAFRSYYREALGGAPYVSELLTGSTTSRPGLYFSQAVRDSQGATVGVVVLKLKGESLVSMVDSLRVGEQGRAFLVDEYGVVLSHTDRARLYHSLAPLPPEVLQLPVFDRRFASVGLETIPSLGLEALARALVGASAAGHTDYTDAARVRRIVGFAPLKTRPWTVGVEVPDAEFSAPLARLARRTALSVGVVGLAVTVLALLLASGIVRPLLGLIHAAQAVERGELDGARVPVRSEDEVGMLSRAFNTMVAGLAERERERDVFGRLVSPEVREKLLGGELRLGGETRHVAVLFSDVRGFSSLSERMSPQAVVALLNEYLTEMAEAVRPFRGYINNFIGDAIVVVFGAPLVEPDVELRAARAAVAMRARLAELNVRRVARGDFPLETGIGICAGEVVAGQIGSPERLLYTIIGDTVNIAARLEALTKEYPGHSILVTHTVAEQVRGEPLLRVEGLGLLHLKGRKEPVDVYALHAADSTAEQGTDEAAA